MSECCRSHDTRLPLACSGGSNVAQIANAEAAVKAAGSDAQIEKVEDIQEIVRFGAMMTPALAIDGKVKVVGKVASADEIGKMLT